MSTLLRAGEVDGQRERLLLRLGGCRGRPDDGDGDECRGGDQGDESGAHVSSSDESRQCSGDVCAGQACGQNGPALPRPGTPGAVAQLVRAADS